MSATNFEALNEEQLQQALDYEPGYDWLRDRFGPPPGIPRAMKENMDRMSDQEYLRTFLRLSQEEKESLMVSEAERRRTFTAHWPIETIVKANDCAKEGFYYTGVADRVQCAFCGGIVRNWERGDVPKFKHKNYFNYCKMVQNRPCPNIPFSSLGIPRELCGRLTSNSTRKSKPTTLGDLNINTVRPRHPAQSVLSKRKETYRRYPENNPIEADQLCEAGFMYDGIGDKVKCFWCDGALELWSRGDDPWVEHAKWYPGCTYVQQAKGLDFIRQARTQMTPENIATADSLIYNKGDVAFLVEDIEVFTEPESIDQLHGYQFCKDLGYDEKYIRQAYAANVDVEFEDQTKLVGIVQDLDEGDTTSLDEYKAFVENTKKAGNSSEEAGCSNTRPKLNLMTILNKNDELTLQESEDLISALKCKLCKTNTTGAALLPCGCYCICQECTRSILPTTCLVCNSMVRGAFRTFLA